jgi:hypothetical protein
MLNQTLWLVWIPWHPKDNKNEKDGINQIVNIKSLYMCAY